MIARKLLYMTCFSLTGAATAAWGDTNSPPLQSLTVGIGSENAPRYSGSDKRHWQVMPVVQARDNAFFFDSLKGLGYDLQSDNGLYLEHTLGYSFGRSDRNSGWRDGSNELKGMGNIRGAINTAVAVGWMATPWLSFEGKATLPLSDSQGVQYQTSATLVPFQNNIDTLAIQGTALFGDSRYTNTFYGVNQQQSLHSGYAAYQTSGGFYGFDNNVSWSHQLTPRWSTAVSADYIWLGDRAKDSPIVFRSNQTLVSLAVLYGF
ncbi:MipA/OmpV family protein [Rouxiella silvae]|uniref:MipA/OmpV family protein n=1 Tax=Rouxiella silvae TaxID=1646373 RepID=A0AA40X1L5_9GAMM|nr:MipA/OmpV family protein [Rouxiella silvae]KQN52003.1 MltA-interacting MipA family protein [Serratia sp. Leaf50]MBF6637085.1 MipA/OmpV family protein [Rouxiella silvae]